MKMKEKKEKKEKTPMDPGRKKKIRRRILIGIVTVLVLFFVVSGMVQGSSPMPVATTTANKGEIEQTISTSGTVTAERSKSYFAQVNVQIGTVNVSAGDLVKAGDVLIAYDETSLITETQLAELKQQAGEGSYQNSVQSNNEMLGDLKEATVNLEVLEQQIADTEAYITGLENKIANKKSELQHFGALLQISLLDWQDQPDSDEYMNLQKMVQLNNYEQNNNEEIKGWEAELQVYNKMLSEYQEYRAEMKSQKNSAEAGKMTVGANKELEANSQSQAIEAEENLTALQEVAGGIRAEFDGVVTEIEVVEGQSPAQGSKLLTLESIQEVSVKIAVTKYDLDKIALGQKATVTIGGKEYEGEVSKINKMAQQNQSGAAVVGTEIKIVNPDSDVYLGVEAKVIISTDRQTDTVIIPVGAVNVDMSGEFVYLVEDNILVKKPVVTGISSDTMIQILEGIEEGDQVVTEVTTGVTEGMSVMAVPAL